VPWIVNGLHREGIMLELRDFYYLPQIEPLVEQLVAGGPGLTVVAGLDPRHQAAPGVPGGFLPSGRPAIFRILMRQILVAHPGRRAVVVAESGDALRIPRAFRRRIELLVPGPSEKLGTAIARAAARRPDLLVVDRLCAESALPAFEAAKAGLRVLAQLDTIFRGAGIARHLVDLGVPRDLLGGLSWVVAVQRLATLCPHCKVPDPVDAERSADLSRRYSLPGLADGGTFYRPAGCAQCGYTGRAGDITAFDVYRAGPEVADPLHQPSSLPLEAYMLGLAARGDLPLEDVLNLEAEQLRQTYRLLVLSEQAMDDARLALERRLAELEAANRVLHQRTEALISLESIGQALIESRSLAELAAQLCRHAGELCGADRSILYFLHPEQGITEALAVSGWDAEVLHKPLDAAVVLGGRPDTEPAPFRGVPPGVVRRPTDVTADGLRAALRVPLVVQDEHVGLLIVHTSQKNCFAPGEVALLRSFANQAAVAIQRAGLVEALQDKIAQLEAAQASLVQKERMERELELARQVQQSVLPRIFPLVPGYTFAARNRPARQVGGDFYDVIFLHANRFGIVVGDVSDKGMPAALYMALSRSLILAEARRSASPRTVLHSVHHLLQELGQPGLFVTVFYGIVDAPARRLTYARAGHDRPLLLRGEQAHLLGGEGTFLGFPDLDDLNLSEESLFLQPGDKLVLYTDGLSDVLAPNGRPFGVERLEKLLRDHRHLPPEELCSATFTSLAAYQSTASQYDDMTMLVVEVT
jgi:sigma-B regulation protein RsbU (phosphoserine phosphatase)